MDVPYTLIVNLLFVGLVTRLGVLCAVTTYTVFTITCGAPLTLDFSLWYGGTAFVALAAIGLLAAYGFRTTLAGRPLLKDELL